MKARRNHCWIENFLFCKWTEPLSWWTKPCYISSGMSINQTFSINLLIFNNGQFLDRVQNEWRVWKANKRSICRLDQDFPDVNIKKHVQPWDSAWDSILTLYSNIGWYLRCWFISTIGRCLMKPIFYLTRIFSSMNSIDMRDPIFNDCLCLVDSSSTRLCKQFFIVV